tara:strand:+ start:783 stop:944 length:162 start_codon:yes stop_codon:yes gene_type:complete
MNPIKDFNSAFVSIKVAIPNIDFELKVDEFIFVKVERNYLEVFYLILKELREY